MTDIEHEIGRLRRENAHLIHQSRAIDEQHRAEIERLRAENERLRTYCGGNCRYWEARWRDEYKEIERLRAALEDINAGTDPVKMAAKARRALEGK